MQLVQHFFFLSIPPLLFWDIPQNKQLLDCWQATQNSQLWPKAERLEMLQKTATALKSVHQKSSLLTQLFYPPLKLMEVSDTLQNHQNKAKRNFTSENHIHCDHISQKGFSSLCQGICTELRESNTGQAETYLFYLY